MHCPTGEQEALPNLYQHQPPILNMTLRSNLRLAFCRLTLKSPVRDKTWREAQFKRYGLDKDLTSTALDLGCGLSPRNPFCCAKAKGIDIRSSDQVVRSNLTLEPIPFADSSFSVVTAFDFLEHMPRVVTLSKGNTECGPESTTRFPLIELMNEVYRVLRPGGIFFSSTPCYPWPMAFSDPTHVNIMTEETLANYFCLPKKWASIYGFLGSFNFSEGFWTDCHYNALLQKPLDD